MPSVDPLTLPLYDTSKISYLGRFELPAATSNETGLLFGQSHEGFYYWNQGSGGIAYSPTGDGGNGSLFIGGASLSNNKVDPIVAEVSIPEPKLTASYNVATLLQDPVVAAGAPGVADNVIDEGHVANGVSLSGLLVHNDALIMSVCGTYTAIGKTNSSLFRRDSLNLSTSNVLGPYKVTNLSEQRIVSNGLGCELPDNWRSTFGGYKALVGGGGNMSTMNNACHGPGFHLFNPDELVGSTTSTVPGVNLVYYFGIDAAEAAQPDGYWGFGDGQGIINDHWNGISTHRGSIMLPESRTVMAYGFGGTDDFYDEGGIITGGDQGVKATPPGFDRFYLYDAQDLKDSYDGVTSPMNVQSPYAVFDMDILDNNTENTWIDELNNMRALTFDALNRRAYIYERRSLNCYIHVLEFAGGNTALRSNNYDAAWLSGPSGWVESAKSILSNATDQVEGMVIHIGDSLCRNTAYGAWAQDGLGKTTDDIAICDWIHADLLSAQSVTSIDGFKLAHPYFCAARSYTVGDGRGPWHFIDGVGMPSETDQATARSMLDDCGSYSNDIDLVTLIAGIQKPQYCTITFNLDAANPGIIHADFIAVCDYLEAQGIVPILYEYTYRNVWTDPETAVFNALVDAYNPALEAFATSRGYPFIPLNTEMLHRIPLVTPAPDMTEMTKWDGKFLSGDGIHYTGQTGGGVNSGGYDEYSDPYQDGGYAGNHETGAPMLLNGYGLKGWLFAQKMKQIKLLVNDTI